MEKSFTEKYAGAFQSLEQNIAKRRSNHVLTAMGFTSNLDLLCDFSTSRLNSLLDEFLSGEHLLIDSQPVRLYGVFSRSPALFLRRFLWLGKEAQILQNRRIGDIDSDQLPVALISTYLFSPVQDTHDLLIVHVIQ